MSRSLTVANLVQEIRTGGLALIDDSGPERASPGTWILKDPEKVMVAANTQAIAETLAQMDQARADLHWVALLNYELGFWFEERLFHLRDSRHPPLMAICFRSAHWLSHAQFDGWLQEAVCSLPKSQARAGIADLRVTTDLCMYRRAVRQILQHIGAGDCYQVNFTWSLHFRYFGSPLALYQLLRVQQPVQHGAFVQLGGRSVLSLSPELFLERRDHQLRVRPMKGTIQRAGAAEADLADTLRNSEKDRAENLMIVDLMRNDLGRLAKIGTVRVEELFGIESYPTILQMVSTISAQIPTLPLYTILAALFPCGSVTGAPKIRAMEIIHELESRPRGLYTGSIGHLRPGGDFSFNVAIRTLELQENGIGVLGIGSGIVADSKPDDEHDECLAKARFLTDLPVDFQLIETMAAYPNSTAPIPLLPLHLERLRKSSRYFGFRFPERAIRSCLEEITSDSQRCSVGRRIRLRLQAWKSGEIYVTHEPLPASLSSESWKITFASERVDSRDIFLRHKTTAREIYDRALQLTKKITNLFDLVFLNERQEVTEGARSNLFAVIDGIWITPPVDCGLLAGVRREQILRDHRRKVIERALYVNDLRRADQLYMSNAVHGLIQVELIPEMQKQFL